VLARHAAVGGVAVSGGRALVAEWAKGRVRAVALPAVGSSARGKVSTYLSGFRNPMPVLVTASGTVLVGDWGTGRIVRVTR